MINGYLPEDCQEKYEMVINYINHLSIKTFEKQELIDRVDTLLDWVLTSD